MPPSARFGQFIVKVHARCDLACDHCYVYEQADQSWRGRSLVLSEEVARQAAERIAEHTAARGLDSVTVIFHGGEPLLTGVERMGRIISLFQESLAGPRLTLAVHTNGVRLDDTFCALFRERGVRVGVSLDGGRSANDLHRRFRSGASSYDQVRRALSKLSGEYSDIYAGILCTIDVRNDPIAVYEELLSHNPPGVDFLLPHHTWDHPPYRPSPVAYADWLKVIFDRWDADGRPLKVRIFDSIISTSRGGPGFTESLGLDDVDLVVIETDGGYEQVDSLKAVFDGAPATGLDVFENRVDELAAHPGIMARRGGLSALCATCRSCAVVASCGGGLFAHRYRTGGSGFANPSVYCADLKDLIEHVQARTSALSAAALRSLASGYGSAEAIAELRRAELVAVRVLVKRLESLSQGDQASELLATLRADHSAALDSVLEHPYVRPWAVDRVRVPRPDDGLLTAVAAVAAARAGLEVSLKIPVRDRAVFLPGVGRFTVPWGDLALLEVRDGYVDVPGSTAAEPVRRLTAGSHTVALDDLDPWRDCHAHPVARVGDREFALWRERFTAAWALLESDFADYLPGVSAALSTIVPLHVSEPGHQISSAARQAFGAVAIGLPESAELLCLLILHEFQHVKLGAVLDHVELFDPADDRLFHAPWRADPRPLEGLLQGTYAHIAVADFWRRRAAGGSPQAARCFADWYPRTVEAVGTLEGSGALTGLGSQFVAGMRETLESWV